MGACRVPDRGSIPRRGDFFFMSQMLVYVINRADNWRHSFRQVPLLDHYLGEHIKGIGRLKGKYGKDSEET